MQNTPRYRWFYLKVSTMPKQQAPIVKLVDQILAARRRDAAADVSELEEEIDGLVYQLYNLTPNEIAIVEGARR